MNRRVLVALVLGLVSVLRCLVLVLLLEHPALPPCWCSWQRPSLLLGPGCLRHRRFPLCVNRACVWPLVCSGLDILARASITRILGAPGKRLAADFLWEPRVQSSPSFSSSLHTTQGSRSTESVPKIQHVKQYIYCVAVEENKQETIARSFESTI